MSGEVASFAEAWTVICASRRPKFLSISNTTSVFAAAATTKFPLHPWVNGCYAWRIHSSSHRSALLVEVHIDATGLADGV